MIAIGDDYWIEDDSGAKVFKVNGKVARIRDTWVLEDAAGDEVARDPRAEAELRDAIKIEFDGGGGHGQEGARRDPRPLPRRGRGRRGPEGAGNIVDHEYEIERDGDTIAEISKKWFRVRDTYGVECSTAPTACWSCSVTVAVDALAHDLL